MRHYNEREKEYIRDVIERMKTANERELRMIWIFARTVKDERKPGGKGLTNGGEYGMIEQRR